MEMNIDGDFCGNIYGNECKTFSSYLVWLNNSYPYIESITFLVLMNDVINETCTRPKIVRPFYKRDLRLYSPRRFSLSR